MPLMDRGRHRFNRPCNLSYNHESGQEFVVCGPPGYRAKLINFKFCGSHYLLQPYPRAYDEANNTTTSSPLPTDDMSNDDAHVVNLGGDKCSVHVPGWGKNEKELCTYLVQTFN